MIIGKLNKLDNISNEINISGTVSALGGFEENNIIDEDTLKLYKFQQGAGTTTIDWTTGITAQAICLFNVTIETNVTIKTYDTSDVLIESQVFTNSNTTGFEYQNIYYPLTDTTTGIGKIELVFTASDGSFFTSVGFIWVGDLINFGCAEKIQPFDESNDQVSITRTNSPDVNREYNFQAYNVTLKKENDFETLRSNFRTILSTGYATKRPVIIDEPFLTNDELFLGVLDAPRVAYDLFETGQPNTFISQTTIGLREVF